VIRRSSPSACNYVCLFVRTITQKRNPKVFKLGTGKTFGTGIDPTDGMLLGLKCQRLELGLGLKDGRRHSFWILSSAQWELHLDCSSV